MRHFGCNHVGFGLFVFLGGWGGSQFDVKHSVRREVAFGESNVSPKLKCISAGLWHCRILVRNLFNFGPEIRLEPRGLDFYDLESQYGRAEVPPLPVPLKIHCKKKIAIFYLFMYFYFYCKAQSWCP